MRIGMLFLFYTVLIIELLKRTKRKFLKSIQGQVVKIDCRLCDRHGFFDFLNLYAKCSNSKRCHRNTLIHER